MSFWLRADRHGYAGESGGGIRGERPSQPDDSGWRSRVRALPDSLIVNGLFVRCQPGDFKFGGLGIRDWSEWILIVPLPRGT